MIVKSPNLPLYFLHFILTDFYLQLKKMNKRKRPHFCDLSQLYPLSLSHHIQNLHKNLFCYYRMYRTLTNSKFLRRLPYRSLSFYNILCNFNRSFFDIIFHKNSPGYIFLQCMQGNYRLCSHNSLILVFTIHRKCSCYFFHLPRL